MLSGASFPVHLVRYFDARGHWHLLVHRYRFGDGPGVAPADILVAGHGYNDFDIGLLRFLHARFRQHRLSARAASARSTLRRASLRADQRASRRRCVEIGASGTRWTAGSGSLAAIRPSTAAFPTTPARQHRTLRSNAPSCESTRSRGSTATSTLFWPVCHVFSSYTTPHAASQKKTKKMWCRVYST